MSDGQSWHILRDNEHKDGTDALEASAGVEIESLISLDTW